MLKRFPVRQEQRPRNKFKAQLPREAYRLGVGLLAVDELQFMTQSASANTRVAQTISQLSLLGPPLVYAMNYSLGHRLMRRPPEERQRLLARPLVLLPAPAGDISFVELLDAYQKVAPDLLKFDPRNDAPVIREWTAGLRRLVVDLISLDAERALRAKTCVTVATLAQVYRSQSYSANREDVEAMHVQNVTGRKVREDLWCPFESGAEEIAAAKSRAEEIEIGRMNGAIVASTMSPRERLNFKQAQRLGAACADSAPVSRRQGESTKGKPDLLLNLDRVREALSKQRLSGRRGSSG